MSAFENTKHHSTGQCAGTLIQNDTSGESP
jgi:hypothetical protein